MYLVLTPIWTTIKTLKTVFHFLNSKIIASLENQISKVHSKFNQENNFFIFDYLNLSQIVNITNQMISDLNSFFN
jgi:hypothetical protein